MFRMLRNSHSPTSSRDTPIVTRSYSRLTETAIQQTPSVRCFPPKNHIKTVERNMEIADDDDEEIDRKSLNEEQDEMNNSQFIYKQHFSISERLQMFWITCKSSAAYSWKTFKRQFIPGFSTVKDVLMILVFTMILCKYISDNISTLTAKTEVDNLKNDIESKFDELARKHAVLTEKLEHLQKIGNGKNEDSREFDFEMKAMKEQIDVLKNELGDHKYLIEKAKIIEQNPPPSTISTKVITNSLPGVNVANSLIGAKIDQHCSSRTVSAKDGLIFDMFSYFMSFKDGYVLLDREILQPGEAWCTYDDHAYLTIKLAKNIQPTSVSYQHVKWNGIIPNNAPKIYDVVACHSPCCTETTPLATNCTYDNSDGRNSQEQFCSVSEEVEKNGLIVDHVQFRFKENQGNMTKTCAYLIRVYGTIIDAPPTKSQKTTTISAPSDVLLDYSKQI